MRKEFLVCYDYGQGGVWAIIRADTEADIVAAYPELTVFEPPPPWMTSDDVERIRRSTSVDIDEQDHPFVAALLRARSS